MILSPSSWDSTSQFADADKNREVTEPDDDEAVDETSRSTTVNVRMVRRLESDGSSLLCETN